MALNEQQKRFCREYLLDLNATKAAERAEYSVRTANEQAARMMARADVQAEIARLKAERAQRDILRADEVLREVRRTALSDIRKLFTPTGSLIPPQEWDDDTAAAVSSIEVDEIWEGRGEGRAQVGVTRKIRLWDKTRSLSLAMEHLGITSKLTLETILEILGPELAGFIRQLVADRLPRGDSGDPSNGGAGGS